MYQFVFDYFFVGKNVGISSIDVFEVKQRVWITKEVSLHVMMPSFDTRIGWLNQVVEKCDNGTNLYLPVHERVSGPICDCFFNKRCQN